MISNKQEFLFRRLVDEAPGIQSMLKRFLGLEGQRHGAVVAIAVDRFSQRLESLHHNDLQAIGGIEGHVGKQKLPVVYGESVG